MLVYENAELEVFHRPGSSPFTLCTFGHLHFRSNGSHYWGARRAEALDLDCIGIVARTDNWYPEASVLAAWKAIRHLLVKPVVHYGHSMGAYGAIKHSRLFGCAGVVASAPMTSIDPADVPEDRRYHAFFDAGRNAGMAIRADDLSGRIVVVYDPFEARDREHVERLRSMAPAHPFHAVHADFFGHEAVQVLADLTAFTAIVGQALHGMPVPFLARHIRTLKRRSAKYHVALACHVSWMSRGRFDKDGMIARVIARLDRLDASALDWRTRVIRCQLLSELAGRRGDYPVGILHLRAALQIELSATGRREPNMLMRIADLLAADRRWEEAVSVLGELADDALLAGEAARRVAECEAAARQAGIVPQPA